MWWQLVMRDMKKKTRETATLTAIIQINNLRMSFILLKNSMEETNLHLLPLVAAAGWLYSFLTSVGAPGGCTNWLSVTGALSDLISGSSGSGRKGPICASSLLWVFFASPNLCAASGLAVKSASNWRCSRSCSPASAFLAKCLQQYIRGRSIVLVLPRKSLEKDFYDKLMKPFAGERHYSIAFSHYDTAL